MILPVKWLREYVELPAKASDLADLLTLSGTKVEAVGEKNGSDILHLEITTNRPDCLSLVGLAVEIAAVSGKKFEHRAPKVSGKAANNLPLTIEIKDKKACPRYIGRVFDNVQVKPSPLAIQQKLDWMDQKAINNAVDITNFVLYELGQPLHAFDYDKIEGKRIVVRRAKKGEKILAIDGNTYELDERILVIADAVKPVAIAGVMGGKDTEVTASTKRILLESAQFEPILIRRASRCLRLSSDSSYRFERSIDPRRTLEASDRAAELLAKYAGAVPASEVKDKDYSKPVKGAWMRLRLERMNALLGAQIKAEKASKILKSLGFKVKRSGKDLKVKTLLQRRDVKREVDLIEEVVRVYGFNKIPEAIPPTRHQFRAEDASRDYAAVRRLKEFLAAQGLFEAVTFSLLSEKALKNLNWAGGEPVKIVNPMSQEQEIMRPTGLAGLLQSLSHNVNRKERDLAFFEIAKRFDADGETNVLSIALTGEAHGTWEARQKNSFYYLKGLVESCAKLWRKTLPSWTELAPAGPYADGLRLGSCGAAAIVDPDVAAKWDLKQPVFYAEIDLAELAKLPDAPKSHVELAKYPPVKRDLAFLVPLGVPVAEIREAMRRAGEPHLKDAAVFDQYTGQNVPKDKRSLAFSLEYQKKDGTFTDDEIRAIHDRVRDAVISAFSAELRA